jgi:hypothetical protein
MVTEFILMMMVVSILENLRIASLRVTEPTPGLRATSMLGNGRTTIKRVEEPLLMLMVIFTGEFEKVTLRVMERVLESLRTVKRRVM